MKCGICGQASKDTTKQFREGPKGRRTYDVCPKCTSGKKPVKAGAK